MTDLGKGLFAVSVPEDAKEIFTALNSTALTWKHKSIIQSVKFDYVVEILGTVTKDNISFDVEPYVQKRTLGYWLDYTKPNTRHDYMCDTPKDSFRSLLSSKGLYFENPYKGYKCCGMCLPNVDECTGDLFRESENNLIEKLVIIKKV